MLLDLKSHFATLQYWANRVDMRQTWPASRLYRAPNLMFIQAKSSSKITLPFDPNPKLNSDIPLASKPEPSLAKIFYLSPSQVRPGQLGILALAGSSFSKLSKLCHVKMLTFKKIGKNLTSKSNLIRIGLIRSRSKLFLPQAEQSL